MSEAAKYLPEFKDASDLRRTPDHEAFALKAILHYSALLEALSPFAEAWEIATSHPSVVKHCTMGQLGELAAYEVAGIHFKLAHEAVAKAEGRQP